VGYRARLANYSVKHSQPGAEGKGLTPDVESTVLEKQYHLQKWPRIDCRVEEKSCSCKSNIFYLTYLTVSCLAHTWLDEWFIFDWHGPLDVRDLVCWSGPSKSLDLYV
jgi:hypothetical protein